MKTTKILIWMIDLSLPFLAKRMLMGTMICCSEGDNDNVVEYDPDLL